jgi:hypothetical protein
MSQARESCQPGQAIEGALLRPGSTQHAEVEDLRVDAAHGKFALDDVRRELQAV